MFRTTTSICKTYVSTDVPKTISNQTSVLSTVSVPDTFVLTDVDVIVSSIVHTRDDELDIYIRYPGGTPEVELSSDNGSDGDNYTNTRFDDEAALSIVGQPAPFSGSFRPEVSLIAMDDRAANGSWTLRVYDDANGNNSGTLNGWSIVVCGSSSAAPSADYSDLAGSYGVAWHTAPCSPKLGSACMPGADFSEGADAPDDDGVDLPGGTLQPGPNLLRVNVQDAAVPENHWVRIWMDWDADGIFEDTGGERAYDGPVDAGWNDVSVTAPSQLPSQVYYRVRLYSVPPGGILAQDGPSYGAAAGGEVEDNPLPGPLAVKLTSFAGRPAAGGILVTWETASEHDNAGFNLYRSATVGDIGVRLNDLLIPSDTPGGDQGASYAFLDGAALPGVTYYYTLEDVDLSGHATPHGPVAVTPWWVYMPLVER